MFQNVRQTAASSARPTTREAASSVAPSEVPESYPVVGEMDQIETTTCCLDLTNELQYSFTPKRWEDAKRDCESMLGDLYSPTSDQQIEDDDIQEEVFWTGWNDEDQEGHFTNSLGGVMALTDDMWSPDSQSDRQTGNRGRNCVVAKLDMHYRAYKLSEQVCRSEFSYICALRTYIVIYIQSVFSRFRGFEKCGIFKQIAGIERPFCVH